MKTTLLLGLNLAGCMPSVTPDNPPGDAQLIDSGPNSAADDTGNPALRQTHVLVATISDNYSFGAIATVAMDTLEVSDNLAATSGDTTVTGTANKAVVLNRLNTDTVRVYQPSHWTEPELEFALPDLSNPQDALICNDLLWVTQHNRDRVTAHSLTDGLVMGALNLQAWTGADGYAEATSLLPTDGGMLIAVQQFDQLDNWASEGGAILRAPCDGGTATSLYGLGPSPTLVSSPTPGVLGVKTGTYGALDGAVYLGDHDGLTQDVLVAESELGVEITAAALSETHLVYITTDPDWYFEVRCQDLHTGVTATGLRTTSFISDVEIDDRGRAWITARSGWSDGTPDPHGLYVFDPDTCSSLLASEEPIHTTLNPYSIDFL